MRVLFIVLTISCCYIQCTQEKSSFPPVCLNHISVVLDSLTYQNLFETPFLRDTIGDCETDTITSVDQSYFGKYLMGRDGYLELFSTKGYKNAILGEVGLGFITLRTDDIWRIRDEWRQQVTDSIGIDTSFFEDMGIKKSWYYAIWLDGNDSIQPLNVWLMEYTPERLKEAGFSDTDLKQEITWATYAQKRFGKTFTKLFDRIIAIHLLLRNNEFEYLRKTLTGLGLHQSGTSFSNQFVQVTCDIIPNPMMRIQTITVALSERVTYHRMIISNHLFLEVEGTKAVFTFD